MENLALFVLLLFFLSFSSYYFPISLCRVVTKSCACVQTKQKSRTGGKGSVRRKTKRRTHSSSSDDKRLQNTLKRLGVNNIPAIEEVNLFKDNGTVIHFSNPKVQASIGANTYVISGRAENKSKSLLFIASRLFLQ